jgi:hypothetical protein
MTIKDKAETLLQLCERNLTHLDELAETGGFGEEVVELAAREYGVPLARVRQPPPLEANASAPVIKRLNSRTVLREPSRASS